jgi:NAD(P)-dependent dehydrogenase (short-subunit alcohol dehydrogenase family)
VSDPRFQGRVVFITGASAGVGRATARAFARAGAKVALLAREEAALRETKAEIATLGGQAEVFPADVADADAVFAAAEACRDRLGPVDVWVNNAMATVFGKIGQLSPQEFRRVTEVTYLGYVHGTMAALRQMEPRNRGVIVQVGSALAYRGIPLQAAYCGAKHAIQGFTDSLRTELLHAGSRIRVTTVHLPAVNTPQFDWARTKRPSQPRPVAPVYASRAAADAILHAASHPKREYWLGGSTAMTILGALAAPSFMDWYLSRGVVEGQDREAKVEPDRDDNLMEPVEGEHDATGSFGDEARADAMLFPATATLLAVAAGGLLTAGLTGAALARATGDNSRRRRWRD